MPKNTNIKHAATHTRKLATATVKAGAKYGAGAVVGAGAGGATGAVIGAAGGAVITIAMIGTDFGTSTVSAALAGASIGAGAGAAAGIRFADEFTTRDKEKATLAYQELKHDLTGLRHTADKRAHQAAHSARQNIGHAAQGGRDLEHAVLHHAQRLPQMFQHRLHRSTSQSTQTLLSDTELRSSMVFS